MKKSKLVLSIILCQLAGFIGSIFTRPAIPTWYATLNKPSFNPPNWIFAPVWFSLFLLMGISLSLIWQKGLDSKPLKMSIVVFSVQLTLNMFWSILFFGLKSPLLGLADILILLIAILWTIKSFLKVSKLAGILLIPYFLWVSFASVLNFFIWKLN